MNATLFETDRLVVREFRPADLDDFAALCGDPEVMRYVGDGTTLDRAGVAHWIEVCQGKYRDRGYGTSAVFEKATGDFIGYCGVVRAPDRDFDEIIYVFTKSSWGNGYATEVGRAMLDHVFRISELAEIRATIDAANADSIKVAHKLGMTFAKRVEEDGTEVDHYVRRRGEA